MKKSINYHDEFVDAMNILHYYSSKGGFDKLTVEESDEYDTLAYAVADYEDSIPVFPPEPNQSFEKTILIYMMGKRWKIAETAFRLGISESKLNEVLAGKYQIDNILAEKLHDVLGIKTDVLLQTA
jgi:antitoxin component HigA of HigAB toxin-antitoxin module